MDDSRRSSPARIERSVPRALFAELLAGALHGARIQPSPMATAYLIELLDERVLGRHDGLEGAETLAEALLAARRSVQQEMVTADYRLFTEEGYLHEMTVREHWIIGPAERPYIPGVPAPALD